MPAATQQRRKAQRPSAAKNNNKKPVPAASSITSFTRVSKTVGRSEVKAAKKASVVQELSTSSPASRKRKAAPRVEEDSSADETPCTITVAQPKRTRGRPAKKAIRPEPASRKRVRSPSTSDSERSAVDTGSLLKKLRLESSPSRCSSILTADTSVAGDSDIEKEQQQKQQKLPIQLLDLIELHAAFLKTLTLHYAHNGTNVPADLRTVCPNVARAWGKRKVTDADVRLCLGVLNHANTTPLLSLSNYGRGKICVEIASSQQQSKLVNATPLNENQLNTTFRQNLETFWFQSDNDDSHVMPFIAQSLPRCPVTACASVAKAAPVLSKGQRRLDEFRMGLAAKKEAKENKGTVVDTTMTDSSSSTEQQQKQQPDLSKMSLLDRIRYKSLLKSSATDTSLTPEQVARRAALQRLVDVSGVLGMLSRSSADSSRASFPMLSLQDRLRDSLRTGISREEGIRVVRLLAEEVAPEWARVVKLRSAGKMVESVVLETECQPSKIDLEMRVRDLLARKE